MEFMPNMPIYIQVVNEIKRLMIKGDVQPGEKLLSARDMALQYQINPNTAARVYRELEQQELCFTKRGLGTFLTEEEGVVEKLRREQAENLTKRYLREFLGLGFSKDEIRAMLLNALA